MKLYLLRVGADSTEGGGGLFSRIYDDGTFTFLPIPISEKEKANEGKWINNKIMYRDFKWRNQPISATLFRKETFPNKAIHNDPEFESFTYGSPYRNETGKQTVEKNYQGLLDLKQSDVLAFYAAFTRDGRQIDGLYLFAYFVIDQRVPWKSLDDLDKEQQCLVKNNAHFIHQLPDQVVVIGNREKSKLFNKAVLLSSKKDDVVKGTGNYKPCKNMKEKLGGYDRALNRSSLRAINASAESFKESLNEVIW